MAIKWSSYNEHTFYVGDFNIHHNLWKYACNGINGEGFVDLSDFNQLQLVFDDKNRGTFIRSFIHGRSTIVTYLKYDILMR